MRIPVSAEPCEFRRTPSELIPSTNDINRSTTSSTWSVVVTESEGVWVRVNKFIYGTDTCETPWSVGPEMGA